MNEHDAAIWNAAIDAALREYKNGVFAIHKLRAKHVVTIEHIGRSTKQEVKEIE